MRINITLRAFCAFLVLSGAVGARGAEPSVAETPRKVPVAGSADIVIVGGSSGAVSAAVAAAKSGATVFLVAPRPYLGEDIAGPMRLWLEPGEEPASELAQKMFQVEKGSSFDPSAIVFKYESSVAPEAQHKDTNPPSKLSDGVLGSPNTESVQYGGDVAIICDLRGVVPVKAVRTMIFHRDGDFAAQSVNVEVCNDKRTWKPVAEAKCNAAGDDRVVVSVPIDQAVRFVRLTYKMAEGSKRLLIGEIAFSGPEGATATKTEPADKKRGPYRPMHIKKTLDDALLASNVKYLYNSTVSEVLRDKDGQISGVVIANRSGRQAILSKVIIDATDRAWTTRMTGAAFEPYPVGTNEFKFVQVGGPPKQGDGVTANPTGLAYPVAPSAKTAPKKESNAAPVTSAELIEYTLKIQMTDGNYASFARAEQQARDLTSDPGVLYLTDELFQLPPDPMKGVKKVSTWEGPAKIDLDAFKPANVDRVWVLGGCADVARDVAAKLVRPVNLMEVGTRVGEAAAAEAKTINAPTAASVSVAPDPRAGEAKAMGTVGEMLSGLRQLSDAVQTTVESGQRGLPILGEYDIVVVGGGTGGAPAAISGGRAKAKTLLIEHLHGMGGVGTMGRISTYYHGYRGGFTATVPGLSTWDPIDRTEWWRAQAREGGAEIWFGTVGSGAITENGKVKGIIVVTPQGRGVVLSKVVIDATGNSDIAAAAGAKTDFMDPSEPAFQGTGLPPLNLGRQYTNTDFTIVDENDAVDVWHVLTYAKRKYTQAFDLGQLIDTRERRRIIGEFTMTLADAINLRTYPDTIHVAQSNFDTHGFTVDPYLLLEHPQKKSVRVNVPYRCLLPKGLDGILVIGLGVSAHRDVMPLLRMQPDIQNQGYVAAQIAAVAAKTNKPLREVDLKPLQEQFAEMEIIPRPMEFKDSYPLPDAKIAEAVAAVKSGGGMSVIFTHTEKALPLLKQAFANAAPQDKPAYARTLAVLGDNAGLDILIAEVEKIEKWDQGWNYKAMGQFGHALSDLDTLIVAIGRTRDKRGLPCIYKKMALLDAKSEFSHHRAVALALEMIGDPSSIQPLFELLNKPDMQGHTIVSIDRAAELSGTNVNDNTTRSTSIREVSLARALYRCGDKDGLGKKILTAYKQDFRSFLARHADLVLAAK